MTRASSAIRLAIRVGAITAFAAWSAGAQPGSGDGPGMMLMDGQTVPGVVSTIDAEGVLVGLVTESDAQSARFGWDAVYAPSVSVSQELAPLVDDVRRGLGRFNRQDLVAAEPLLESAHNKLQATTGPTSIAVARALLTCRVARGSVANAVEPLLDLLNELESAESATSYDAIDPVFELHPEVSPFWTPGSAPTRQNTVSEQTERVLQVRAWYNLAIAATSGTPGEPNAMPTRDSSGSDPGVALLADVVGAWAGVRSQRPARRASLESRVKGNTPSWVRAWCQFALGRSLLLEDNIELRRKGLLWLVRVPAEHAIDQPYLAGLALAEAADAAERIGWDQESDRLADVFWGRYAGHAASEWLGSPQALRPVLRTDGAAATGD